MTLRSLKPSGASLDAAAQVQVNASQVKVSAGLVDVEWYRRGPRAFRDGETLIAAGRLVEHFDWRAPFGLYAVGFLIFAVNDFAAIGAMGAIRDAGRQVGRD